MGRGKGQRILALEAVEVLTWDVVLAARRKAARVGVEGSPHIGRRGRALVAGRRGAVVSTVGGRADATVAIVGQRYAARNNTDTGGDRGEAEKRNAESG